MRHPPRRPIGLAWLVWLALLLPMAQAAAGWHAYAHVAEGASGGLADKQSLHAQHCDLCLAAAAVGGAALVDNPPAHPTRDARHEIPDDAAAGVAPARPTPAYQSRAPPRVPR